MPFETQGPEPLDAVINVRLTAAEREDRKTMTETMAPLTGPMKVGIGEAYSVSFAGAPAGDYKYYCTPHLPFGMHAKITVQ